MTTPSITLWHNPRCSTSRNTLALLREKGIEPHIIDYLKTPPSRAALQALAAKMPGGAATLLRTKEPLCKELDLTRSDVTEDAILDAIAAHPILLNRPVAETDKSARACRPVETVLELL